MMRNNVTMAKQHVSWLMLLLTLASFIPATDCSDGFTRLDNQPLDPMHLSPHQPNR